MKQNKNKTLLVGIIGAGEIVSKVHLPVLLNNDLVSVIWITDLNEKKARYMAHAYRVPYIKLPKDLTELPHADIVLLAIPFGARRPYYEVLQKRSSAIYVEKPFSLTLEQHKKICSLFPPYNLACGFQRRLWGPTLLIKNLIEANTLGKLGAIRFGLGSPSTFVGLAGFFSDIRLSGGGILFDVGVHGIDTILFCTQAKSFKVNSVQMMTRKGFDIHTKADFTITNQNNNNIKCNIIISSLQETINQLEFIFDSCTVSYSLFDLEGRINLKPNTSIEYRTLSLAIDNKKNLYPVTPFQTFHEFWLEFINSIKTKKTNYTSASESLLTTELIEALYKEGAK